MPLRHLPDKRNKKYDYKVFPVDTVEQKLLDDMANEWYELDYAITRPEKIYLVFRRCTYND